MKNKLKIFFITPEVAPFTKTQDLGEVSQSLPKYLKNLGHDVRVMMPNYKSINERKYVLRDVIRLQGLEIGFANKKLNANGKSAFIPDSKVQIYFFDNKEYFDRDGIYGEKQDHEYKDNVERFLFFCKGCLETLKLLYWQPDIIHCNEWHTAFIPYLLKTDYAEDPFFAHTRTLFSVHDFGNQANASLSWFEKFGLNNASINQSSTKVNLLDLGMQNADLLSTVSESYMVEVQEDSVLKGDLKKTVRSRKADLISIPYGIDDQVWNPETDSVIPAKYSSEDLSGKTENKQALLKHFSLDASEEIPVLSMMPPLNYEKGLDLILDSIEELMKLDIVLVLAGTAEEKYHKRINAIQKKFSDRIAVEYSPDQELLHLINAGSDFILIPSKLEPCGLSQLRSLTYGTVPIVRETGGLADTVKSFESTTGKGNGFVFKRFAAKDFVASVMKALKVYKDKEVWSKLVHNGMKQDFSWNSSAQKYVKLYQKLTSIKR